ncbi:MAG TPA: L-2-hydroxyglutarate oxidase, partial [Gemmatimonadaceae bacterium]|nr:L-2-hydroxyglutarate oxidase [Gemmatimonadaceae bacterium]
AMRRPRVIVVGGGLVGLGAAYKLLRAAPATEVVVLEKEPDVARHQSGHNSGVLHAGLYYVPGSAKARLAVAGIRQMTAFCREHGIAHEICGKLVVATNETEVPRLQELLFRGRRNGLSDLTWLEPSAMREIEPEAAGVAAVRVPEEGIVDYPAVARALAGEIAARGGRVVRGAEVRALRRDGASESAGWVAETEAGEFAGDLLVNCAGLHCDRVARMAGERPEVRIVPFRGEYYVLRPERQHLVRHLIYPVPDPAFPFLGVHFTRMIGGGVEAGPNAVLAFAREGYRKRDVNVRDLASALGFPGLWRFLARHPAMAWAELRRSFSRELFGVALQRLVPALRADDMVPGGAGVRAQAMRATGELVQDFALVRRPAALHVLNAPSPGATASLAIGDEIVALLADRPRVGSAPASA